MFSNHFKMPIFEKDKIIFIHIPKTAGTSIGKFFDIDYEKKYINSHKFKHNTFIEYANILKDNLNNYKIFSIVRNPYDRIFSYYKYHTYNMNNRYSFKEYLFRYLNNTIYLTHKTQTSFLINNNNIIDSRIKIIRYENLNEEIKNLPKLNISKNFISKKEIYNQENIEVVKKHFLEDFINFGYSTDIQL